MMPSIKPEKMSIQPIEMAPEPLTATPSSKSNKPRSEKKTKSKEDKKRKRDHTEDSDRHKSKKHRTKEAVTSNMKIIDEPSESPFHTQTSTLYLPLSPISQRQPLEGMCAEHLSPLILTYYPPLSGVILSYSNPRLAEQPFQDDGSETLLKSIDEFGVGFAWVTAEFLLFKPERGGLLEGYINLQNEGHLGIVCWNLFNASIERQRLPKDWNWIGVEETEADGQYANEGIGYYVDGTGAKIDGTIKFRVKDIESSADRERGFLSIEGTMLDSKDENELLDQEASSRKRGRDGSGRRLGGSRALGATSLGIPIEPDAMDVDGKDKKRRSKY
jgi:DNA-directed RNA polymerase I subunit RPA43